jgi:Zn-finger nucleic acid-binding protein
MKITLLNNHSNCADHSTRVHINEATGHHCPVCGVALTHRVFHGVSIEECWQCSGVWIAEDTLKSIESRNVHSLQLLDALLEPTGVVMPVTAGSPCPICGRGMEEFRFLLDTHIVLHRCDCCDGLWVAHGQLTQMAVALTEIRRPVTDKEAVIAKCVADQARFEDAIARAAIRNQVLGGLYRRQFASV